ncbi:carbonyl reductase [NADPH] 3-like [Athalia rosae]|uniref:carbonyl reductase [NADPH] 3-like n=1 Tax=Athalia rosae TaxID=37344 RepID=UPI0020349CA6|nr:carbonyl reductase [NADPH] 3-like [Athalia rosae]
MGKFLRERVNYRKSEVTGFLLLQKFTILISVAALFSTGTADSGENEAQNNQRVAVVTGANKGIGFAIVKGLLEKFDGIVYLTARDEARGLAAVEELKNAGFHPRFHQLDVVDDASIERFKNYINETYGGLDILVNNAGIMYLDDAPGSSEERAVDTLEVNYFGLLNVSNALFPLLRPHARVVQMSSSLGLLSMIPGEELRAKLSRPDLTEPELSQMMRDYIELVKTNAHEAAGWPSNEYIVSKVGVAALSRIQQRAFDSDSREDIAVNTAHPGYVNTDLTKHLGVLSPERGAVSSIFAALLPNDTDIKGKFVWKDKSIIDWETFGA